MGWVKILVGKDSIIIILISLLLFTLANFLFVYNSQGLIKLIPQDVVRSISPCYRTLFHHNGESLERSEIIFGDSMSVGSGEEFLNSDPEYGIFNKIKTAS